jgi:hypothetical protein
VVGCRGVGEWVLVRGSIIIELLFKVAPIFSAASIFRHPPCPPIMIIDFRAYPEDELVP